MAYVPTAVDLAALHSGPPTGPEPSSCRSPEWPPWSTTAPSFDCADAAALATFWAGVLDQPVDDGASPDYAVLEGTPGWMFLRVPEPKATKNRLHPDLTTGDLGAEVIRLKELGATHLADHTEDGTTWATLADPEGNEFDVVAG